jgi:hypothetical protein
MATEPRYTEVLAHIEEDEAAHLARVDEEQSVADRRRELLDQQVSAGASTNELGGLP